YLYNIYSANFEFFSETNHFKFRHNNHSRENNTQQKVHMKVFSINTLFCEVVLSLIARTQKKGPSFRGPERTRNALIKITAQKIRTTLPPSAIGPRNFLSNHSSTCHLFLQTYPVFLLTFIFK